MTTDILLLKRSEVAGLLGFAECIGAMEEAFKKRAQGRTLPPELMHVDADGGEFHIKGGGLRGERTYFALKANGGFFGNRAKFGLPNIMGLILLFDGQNGRPLAVMDSMHITILRTGATTAVAAKYLARPESETATVCGCGNQGRSQLTALKLVLPKLKKVFAWDTAAAAAAEFAADMSKKLGMEIVTAGDLGQAAGQSDVIVTSTPAKGFFLKKEHVRKGTFVAAVGADSPEKQEVEPALLAAGTLVVDILEQCEKVGELHHAIEAGLMTRKDVHAELSDVVAGKIKGRTSAEEITIYDTTGSAIQDAAAAALVYEKAVGKGVGVMTNLFA